MSGVNEALEKFDTLRKDSMFLELLKIAILFEQLKEELDTVTDVASKAYRDQNDFNTQVYIGGYRDGLLDIKDDIDKNSP
ncbi:hypothetical protein F6Y05_02710 [Bacillus megaterium]|nr:hypothetical protein [Priestia megaterium]